MKPSDIQKRPGYFTLARNFLVILYFFGIVGLMLDLSREYFIDLFPVSILFSFIILLLFHERWSLKFIISALIIAVVGYLIEVMGVNKGYIFGAYSYGETLGLRLWDTPLIMGINWIMLIYCVFVIFSHIGGSILVQSFFGAVLMVIYDLVLEPVAIILDMWSWEMVKVPVKNYFAWGIISFLMLIFLHLVKVKIQNKLAPYLFFIQLGFFLVLNILLRFIG